MKKVVIIGGGIAGLTAAHVLSDYCQEVTIIERDTLPATPETRPGTPQAYHPHHLTPRGRMILEQLFPGLNNELLQNGAPGSLGKNIRFFYPFGELTQSDPGNDAACSRPFLEWHIRQRVLKSGNVKIMDATTVNDLIIDQFNNCAGVAVTKGNESFPVAADLVVVATGFHSRLNEWLTRHGYTIPEAEVVHTQLGYSTRHYAVPHFQSLPWNLLHIENPEQPAMPTCVVTFMENATMEIVLGNIGGLYPPTDTEGFETALQQLNIPVLNHILRQATPLEAPRGHRIKDVTLRHYEKMEDWPVGLIAMGDAFCTFDPIHGTGMSIAAMQADLLQKTLQAQGSILPTLAKTFLAAAHQIVEPAWWMNAVSDSGGTGVKHLYSVPQRGLGFTRVFMEQMTRFAVNFNQPEIFGLVWLVKTSFLSPHELINRPLFEMLKDAGLAGPLEAMIQAGEISPLEKWKDGICPDIPDFSETLFVSKAVLSRS